jgi:hypothetical protein
MKIYEFRDEERDCTTCVNLDRINFIELKSDALTFYYDNSSFEVQDECHTIMEMYRQILDLMISTVIS